METLQSLIEFASAMIGYAADLSTWFADLLKSTIGTGLWDIVSGLIATLAGFIA